MQGARAEVDYRAKVGPTGCIRCLAIKAIITYNGEFGMTGIAGCISWRDDVWGPYGPHIRHIVATRRSSIQRSKRSRFWHVMVCRWGSELLAASQVRYQHFVILFQAPSWFCDVEQGRRVVVRRRTGVCRFSSVA